MQIHVKLFATLRDRAGIAETALELPTGSSIACAFERLRELYPQLRGFERIAFAVNRAYVPAATALVDGDELALIPPVSGG